MNEFRLSYLDLLGENDPDPYFMSYINSAGTIAKGITNPHAKKWPEDWATLGPSIMWYGTGSNEAFVLRRECKRSPWLIMSN